MSEPIEGKVCNNPACIGVQDFTLPGSFVCEECRNAHYEENERAYQARMAKLRLTAKDRQFLTGCGIAV